MSAAINIGSYYLNRAGEVRGPMRETDNVLYPLTDGEHTYTLVGRYDYSPLDLLTECDASGNPLTAESAAPASWRDVPVTAGMLADACFAASRNAATWNERVLVESIADALESAARKALEGKE